MDAIMGDMEQGIGEDTLDKRTDDEDSIIVTPFLSLL